MDALCDAVEFNETSRLPELPRPYAPNARPSFAGGEGTVGTFTDPQLQYSSNLTQVFRCHLCDRIYERADHLTRHLKSHENARPHKCPRCGKSFNRADLLNRHQASHERYASGNKAPRMSKCDRVTSACNACVSSKSKCQDQKPCARCQTKGLVCETTSQLTRDHSELATKRRTARNKDSALELDQQQTVQNGRATLADHDVAQQSSLTAAQDKHTFFQNNRDTTQHSLAIEHQRQIAVPDHSMLNGLEAPKTNPDYSTISHVARNTSTDQYADIDDNGFGFFDQNPHDNQNLEFLPWNSYFSQDIDFGIGDIDIESVELVYDNLHNSQANDEILNQRSTNNTLNTNRGVSKRYAAFERSPWLWNPTKNDQTLNDQEHISLDEDNIPAVFTPASPGSSISDFACCSIDVRMRDKMLSLLLSLPMVDAQKHSFPSLALLNTIIKVYFAQESYQVDQFIHSATFAHPKSLPHLVVAIVSAGSTFISTPAIWKMGLALQEVVRSTVGQFVCHLSDREPLQKLCVADSGSGNKTIVTPVIYKRSRRS